jgi:microcystin-dependent protein
MGRKIIDMSQLEELDILDFIVVQEESSGITKRLKVSDLVKAITPVGTINLWTAESPPTNWLVCDGSAVSRETYSALFALVGTAFGIGDGSTTFNLPDLSNRVPVGIGLSSSFDELGKKGGAETHTLTEGEMPNHRHTGTTSTNGNHRHTGPFATSQIVKRIESPYDGFHGFSDGATTRWSDYAGDHNHSFNTSYVGGGGSHNNLQPYQVVNFIVKAV